MVVEEEEDGRVPGKKQVGGGANAGGVRLRWTGDGLESRYGGKERLLLPACTEGCFVLRQR